MSRSTDVRRRRRGVLLGAILGAILGPLTCSGIHDDELRCEEAVARLQSCCPGFEPASIRCRQSTSCGGDSSARPQIRLGQSECLLAQSCEELNSSAGAQPSSCARALTLIPDAMTGDLLLCP